MHSHPNCSVMLFFAVGRGKRLISKHVGMACHSPSISSTWPLSPVRDLLCLQPGTTPRKRPATRCARWRWVTIAKLHLLLTGADGHSSAGTGCRHSLAELPAPST